METISKILLKNCLIILFNYSLYGQNIDTLSVGSTSKTSGFNIGGGIDFYFGLDVFNIQAGNIPYYVSSNRNNEFNINLAYLDIKYESPKLKMRFIPAIGTYMNANYINEPGLLKVPIEANAGFKPFKNRDLWVEAGIFSSPYTNETPLSKDHLMYTRSLAPEYVPYYITGVKASWQATKKMKLNTYLINGWQQTQDLNNSKSLGTSLEYKLNDETAIYWNTFIGDERSIFQPDFRMRYFTDLYLTYLKTKKWSFTTCAYFGIQEVQSGNTENMKTWWQANIIGKYAFKKFGAISSRLEYFHDPNSVQITPINGSNGFNCFAYSLCYTLPIEGNALLRFEAKNMISTNDFPFIKKDGDYISNTILLFTNLTFWF